MSVPEDKRSDEWYKTVQGFAKLFMDSYKPKPATPKHLLEENIPRKVSKVINGMNLTLNHVHEPPKGTKTVDRTLDVSTKKKNNNNNKKHKKGKTFSDKISSGQTGLRKACIIVVQNAKKNMKTRAKNGLYASKRIIIRRMFRRNSSMGIAVDMGYYGHNESAVFITGIHQKGLIMNLLTSQGRTVVLRKTMIENMTSVDALLQRIKDAMDEEKELPLVFTTIPGINPNFPVNKQDDDDKDGEGESDGSGGVGEVVMDDEDDN
ncbi:hypothetical protein TrRE_jg3316, partial [Triparma retinervis]